MTASNSGKWAFAFWIITVFTLILGGAVVANDRVRASEDQKLVEKIESTKECMNNNLATVVKEQGNINQQILVSLVEIKSDVKYIKQGMK